ncbi:MAG: helix-turn-helix domain-containing protein [Phycisphaeraceae bacterium]|nr:helix-turn-helix domain-containing protein [Phycisphaeraceae bacterium]
MQTTTNEASARLLTVPVVAQRLAVSERWVWRAISEGTIRAVRLGRATRVRAEDVEHIARVGLPTNREARR